MIPPGETAWPSGPSREKQRDWNISAAPTWTPEAWKAIAAGL
jgi:hypothetical protein